jgi:hypothetical protein
MFGFPSKFVVLAALSVPVLCGFAAEADVPFRDVTSTDQAYRPEGAHLALGAAREEGCAWVFLYIGKSVSLNPMVSVNDGTQRAESLPRFVSGTSEFPVKS